jgi:hypothetical protein
MITPSQARLKEKEQYLEQYDRSRSRSAKRKMTAPSQTRLKEKEEWLKQYDYDRSRSRSAKRLIKGRSVKVRRQSATKKHTRTLEETCAAKSGYELIDMNDGTKSCRKKCNDPKPVRSSSKGRKCIQGIVRVAASSTKKRIRKNRPENDSFLADEDDILTSEQIADKDAAIKKVRQGNRTMKCLGEISTKELEEEIAQRKKEARVYQEQDKEDDLRGKELLAKQAVTDVVVQGKQKKRIAPTAVAAILKG